MSDQNWYVVYTKPKAEFQFRESVTRKQLEVFVPTDQKQMPLFPSYAFVHLLPSQLHLIRYLPGFVRLVSFGDEPSAISESQIGAIKRVSEFDPQASTVSSRLVKGDQVRVTAGPLRGIIGTLVQDQGAHKVALAVPQLNQSLLVNVPLDQVVPAEETLGRL